MYECRNLTMSSSNDKYMHFKFTETVKKMKKNPVLALQLQQVSITTYPQLPS